ncbi:hypothetical protein [Jeotgalibacillus haloalkalitolerans]|uniref:Uncharacterized protein n=1 Tax=Jeotgalibacillus haloalkalitolerans TaxID=3104292 RepID=A0ABU5KKY5_9BACL|nr:hypothetical protein [Jeotgalibacillus sp. HH7-29]MDZ5711375.1 hypothetical protein [Jeotgalibacillus sp. HH7-29]
MVSMFAVNAKGNPVIVNHQGQHVHLDHPVQYIELNLLTGTPLAHTSTLDWIDYIIDEVQPLTDVEDLRFGTVDLNQGEMITRISPDQVALVELDERDTPTFKRTVTLNEEEVITDTSQGRVILSRHHDDYIARPFDEDSDIKEPFVIHDPHDLLWINKVIYLDIENTKAYGRTNNGLVQIDYVTGEPLYDGATDKINYGEFYYAHGLGNGLFMAYDTGRMSTSTERIIVVDEELNVVDEIPVDSRPAFYENKAYTFHKTKYQRTDYITLEEYEFIQ